jgi:low affinity Fe/Cu permease
VLRFSIFPEAVTRWAGSPWVSAAAALWAVVTISSGLVTGFPPWWQTAVYSTGALISVLMLFLIQHTTNRHTNAVLVKLDELVKATAGARNDVIGIEERQVDEQNAVHDGLGSTATNSDARTAPSV